jgi:ATP-dependent DNA ligase
MRDSFVHERAYSAQSYPSSFKSAVASLRDSTRPIPHAGRSDDWTKSKCRAGHEVVIGGWSDENGRFRSLLVGVHRGDHLVYIGRVGTGFGANTVLRIFPRLKAQASNTSPFGGANAPRKARDIHWVKPVLVAEIEFGGWTGDGRPLYRPRLRQGI